MLPWAAVFEYELRKWANELQATEAVRRGDRDRIYVARNCLYFSVSLASPPLCFISLCLQTTKLSSGNSKINGRLYEL